DRGASGSADPLRPEARARRRPDGRRGPRARGAAGRRVRGRAFGGGPRGAAAKRAAQRSRTPAPAAAAGDGSIVEMETGVPRETLARIGRVLTTVPPGFHLNPKMVQQLARRAKMAEGSAPLDWGTAEALA